jgi:hypothetical protein
MADKPLANIIKIAKYIMDKARDVLVKNFMIQQITTFYEI